MYYRNKKTQEIYKKLAVAIDTTNARDGVAVVVYCPEHDENTVFVREANEFDIKFESIGEAI